MMTREDLAKLRADLVADLETRRRRESDPLYEPPQWQGPPTVTKSAGNGGLTYSTRENALAATPAAAGDDAGPFFGDHRDEQLVEAVGEALSLLRREFRHEIAREVTILRNENAELRGMLNAALAVLNGSADAKAAALSTRS